jgi:hypothetical protein
MNAFPALKNFYKNGYSKEVCSGLFTKMKFTDLIDENFVVPGKVKNESAAEGLKKTGTKTKFGKSNRGGNLSRIGSMASIGGRSSRSNSKKVQGESTIGVGDGKGESQVVGGGGYSGYGSALNLSPDAVSRFSEGRNSLASNRILAPTEKLGFSLNPNGTKSAMIGGRLTQKNLNPERYWQRKFTNSIKGVYINELDAPKNIFSRLADRELREKRVTQFMTRTTKEMDETTKREREQMMKKLIK